MHILNNCNSLSFDKRLPLYQVLSHLNENRQGLAVNAYEWIYISVNQKEKYFLASLFKYIVIVVYEKRAYTQIKRHGKQIMT